MSLEDRAVMFNIVKYAVQEDTNATSMGLTIPLTSNATATAIGSLLKDSCWPNDSNLACSRTLAVESGMTPLGKESESFISSLLHSGEISAPLPYTLFVAQTTNDDDEEQVDFVLVAPAILDPWMRISPIVLGVTAKVLPTLVVDKWKPCDISISKVTTPMKAIQTAPVLRFI